MDYLELNVLCALIFLLGQVGTSSINCEGLCNDRNAYPIEYTVPFAESPSISLS